jgi:hypothetical protein
MSGPPGIMLTAPSPRAIAFGISALRGRQRAATGPVKEPRKDLTRRSREDDGGHGEGVYALRAAVNFLPARSAKGFLLRGLSVFSLLLRVKILPCSWARTAVTRLCRDTRDRVRRDARCDHMH